MKANSEEIAEYCRLHGLRSPAMVINEPLPLKAKAIKRDATAAMSKPERSFSEYNEARRIAREIETWAFHPAKWRLADGTWYEPDFMVVHLDGRIEFDDTKAFWKSKKQVRASVKSKEASTVKIKVAAETYPQFDWNQCWQDEVGEWKYRAFGATR